MRASSLFLFGIANLLQTARYCHFINFRHWLTITNPAVFPFANFPCKPAIPLTIITVTSTDPPEGDITGEYTVNVYGSNFSSPAVVMFDGIPATDVVVLNSGEISCTPPPSLTINHFVIGSRYIKGGNIIGWNFKRKVMSRFATLLSRPFTKVKDPMSGFFMIKKEKIICRI